MKLRNIFLILVVVLSTIGTSATPTKAQSACIEVASAADLDAIRGYTDGNYCLTADIDLASYSN